MPAGCRSALRRLIDRVGFSTTSFASNIYTHTLSHTHTLTHTLSHTYAHTHVALTACVGPLTNCFGVKVALSWLLLPVFFVKTSLYLLFTRHADATGYDM